MTKHLRWLSPLGLALALPFTACEEGHHDESCDMPTISVEGDPTTIASGDDVTLTISVENFTLIDPEDAHMHGDIEGTEFRAYDGVCEGHYHVYLDDLMTDPILQAWDEEVTVTVDADPGDHELIVRLNGSDHKFIQPEIKDSVTITVQ